VVWLLNKDFLILVLASNLVSWPIAYYLMDKWLTGFAYRFDFGLSPFVMTTVIPFIVSLIITLIIAFITISSISFKSATANPIDSLQRE
jgi:putative ABC transport system permease protein